MQSLVPLQTLELIHRAQFLPDLDLRMVQALISPEGSGRKMSEFFFGVHSLLEVISGLKGQEKDEDDAEQEAAVVSRLKFSSK